MMKKFEEPMFKLIKITTQDVISTSGEISEIDNRKISVADLTGGSDFVEENLFV